MGYVVAGLLILMAAAYLAVNLGYYAFALVMSVANAASGAPLAYLHGRILAEAMAGTTIGYEVVRLADASAYADTRSNNRIVFEAVNRSRWPINAVTPRCTLAFADGGSADLEVDTRAERTRLDDTGRVSTAVPPGGALRASLRTAEVRHSSPVVRADCAFDLSVPWWIWAAEVPRDRRS